MTRGRGRRYSGKDTKAVLRDGRWLSLAAAGLLEMVEAQMTYRHGGDIVAWLRPARALRPGEVVGSVRQWAERLEKGRRQIEGLLGELRARAPDGRPYLVRLEGHTRHGSLYRLVRYPDDWGHSSPLGDKTQQGVGSDSSPEGDKGSGDSSPGGDESGVDSSPKPTDSSPKRTDSSPGGDEKGPIRPLSAPPFNDFNDTRLKAGAGPERLPGSAPASDNGNLETVLQDLRDRGWPGTIEAAISLSERVGKAAGRGKHQVLALLCDAKRAPAGERWSEFERSVKAGAEASSAGMADAEWCVRVGIGPPTGRGG